MKELTIEEKAIAYDEALEKAKQFHDGDLFAECNGNLVEYIFPELKESDDEKIRKTISDILLIDRYDIDVNIDYPDNTVPATKEQKEIIFMAMKDAGYIFDFDKKELRKLKFRVGDEIKTVNEEPLSITKIDEKGYWSEDLFICDFDSECIWDLVEQKYAEWSEEEEFRMNNLCHFLEEYGNQYYGYLTLQGTISWLKSLKDRVQPKQEWSMYDETILKALIDHFEYKKEFNEAEDYDIVLWLKSLRPQSHWKPSDEQMKALEYIINNAHNTSYSCKIAKELLEQLKKL